MPPAYKGAFYELLRPLTRSRFLTITESWLDHCEERKLRGNPDIFKSVKYIFVGLIMIFIIWIYVIGA